MKKFLLFILVLSMMLSFTIVSTAASKIKLSIDGVAQSLDVMPVWVDYHTLVPMRAIFETLGAEVSWDEATKTITAVKGDTTITLQIGKTTATVNGKELKLDYPAKNIGGRTMVPCRFVAQSLGCTVDWNSKTVVIVSPEKEFHSQAVNREFKLLQETLEGANLQNPSYNNFYSMAEPAFSIPGLNQKLVPQGIEYRKDTNQFYLSGYFTDNSSSAISVVDAATGEVCGEYYLKHMDGTDYSGHVGGIAVSEKDLYIADGCSVYRISLKTVDAIGKTGDLYLEEKINLSVGLISRNRTTGCSYVDCTNGYLWVGNYYSAGTTNEKAIDQNYTALVRAYKLDATQPSGLAAENKAEDPEFYDYVPEVMYFVNEDRIQGLTTTGNYIILTESGGPSPSYLHIYDKTKEISKEVMLMDGGRRPVDVIFLDPVKTVTAIPYGEEIISVGDYAYLSFESGATIYRKNAKACPTDSVWKIPLGKLLSEN